MTGSKLQGENIRKWAFLHWICLWIRQTSISFTYRPFKLLGQATHINVSSEALIVYQGRNILNRESYVSKFLKGEATRYIKETRYIDSLYYVGHFDLASPVCEVILT